MGLRRLVSFSWSLGKIIYIWETIGGNSFLYGFLFFYFNVLYKICTILPIVSWVGKVEYIVKSRARNWGHFDFVQNNDNNNNNKKLGCIYFSEDFCQIHNGNIVGNAPTDRSNWPVVTGESQCINIDEKKNDTYHIFSSTKLTMILVNALVLPLSTNILIIAVCKDSYVIIAPFCDPMVIWAWLSLKRKLVIKRKLVFKTSWLPCKQLQGLFLLFFFRPLVETEFNVVLLCSFAHDNFPGVFILCGFIGSKYNKQFNRGFPIQC